MRGIRRFAAIVFGASLIAACSQKAPESADVPLAFVPADTPYLYANLEPLPAAVTEQWAVRMHEYWPAVFGMYDQMLQQADAKGSAQAQRWIKIARAAIAEIRTHDSWDKLRQIGFKPDARIAVYGVGLVPVLRLELGDPALLRAEVARLEHDAGEKLAVAKIGGQDYWQLGNDTLVAAIAIEGTQLVVVPLPVHASDALKQALLGLTRPAQPMTSTGGLQALAKQYHFSAHGEGYIDFVRLTERLSSAPSGSDAEFAKAVGLPDTATDATCRDEFLALARKFPRLVIGAEELSPQHMRIGAQLEIESALAQQLAAALGAAPGSGAPGAGVIDVSLSLPVLRLKNFWIAQAEAVAAKPFACASLSGLNQAYRESKAKADVTIPPPFSDALGMRFTLDSFALKTDATMPEFTGKWLFASNNPQTALAMAQLALPALKDLKLAGDGKPVPLPAQLLPTATPPLFAAMSDKAIALAAGADQAGSLEAYLRAPAATEAVFLRMYFSGKVYGLMAQSFAKFKALMPADKQAQFEQQEKLLALYEKWLRFGEITFVATPTGVAMHETIEQN